MENFIKEDIDRINELMRLTEEDDVSNYIDSTYLKTSDQAGIGEEETDTFPGGERGLAPHLFPRSREDRRICGAPQRPALPEGGPGLKARLHR